MFSDALYIGLQPGSLYEQRTREFFRIAILTASHEVKLKIVSEACICDWTMQPARSRSFEEQASSLVYNAS